MALPDFMTLDCNKCWQYNAMAVTVDTTHPAEVVCARYVSISYEIKKLNTRSCSNFEQIACCFGLICTHLWCGSHYNDKEPNKHSAQARTTPRLQNGASACIRAA